VLYNLSALGFKFKVAKNNKDERTFEQTHNIFVNNIKQQSTYAYKYYYVQASRILMSSDLQR